MKSLSDSAAIGVLVTMLFFGAVIFRHYQLIAREACARGVVAWECDTWIGRLP